LLYRTAAILSLVLANAAELPANAMHAQLPETTMLGSAKDVAIKGPHTTIDIPVPKHRLRAALNELDSAQSMQLTLRNVSADSPPGTLFAVYVAKTTDPAKRQQVGTISWYGAFMHRRQKRGPEHRTLTYDITGALRTLGGRAVADSGLTVVIDATTGRVPASGSAADVADENALAAREFRPQSNLRIQSVELHAALAT
jgi:hypothetical protein